MRRMLVLMLLLAVAVAAECDVEMTNVVIGQKIACSDGVSPAEAEVYSGEMFYICAEFTATSGVITAEETSIVPKQSVPITGGKTIINGNAKTQQHKTYYVLLNMSTPCEKEFTIPLEVKNKCVQLPPSTIRITPNAINHGENFTIEVANAPKNLDMTIVGLKAPIVVQVEQGTEWARVIPSTECLGNCTLTFSFVDPIHPLCRTGDTILEVRIMGEPTDKASEGAAEDNLMLAILAIVVLGTVATIFVTSR